MRTANFRTSNIDIDNQEESTKLPFKKSSNNINTKRLHIHKKTLCSTEILRGNVTLKEKIRKNTNILIPYFSRGIHHYKLTYESISLLILEYINQLLNPLFITTYTYKKEEVKLLKSFFIVVTDMILITQLSIIFLKLYTEPFLCNMKLYIKINNMRGNIIGVLQLKEK